MIIILLTGLLAFAMESQDIAAEFREENSTLVSQYGNCEEELPKKPAGRQSVDCWPTVGRQTADRFCLKYRLPVGRQWADSWPTVGNVSVTCR